MRGDFRKIGDEGAWTGANAVVGFGGYIWLSHSNGTLFQVHPGHGQYRKVGDSDSWETRLMFGLGQSICLVEQSGTLFAVEPESGAHRQAGPDGEWTNITCGDYTRQNIYCHSSQGTLWAFTAEGQWHQIGALATWKTAFIFAGKGLVTIEQDGSMYRVDPGTGHYDKLSRTQFKCVAGVGMHGHVYACFEDGGLWDLDIETARWSEIGRNKNWRSQALLTTGDNLISLERSGTLFEVQL